MIRMAWECGASVAEEWATECAARLRSLGAEQKASTVVSGVACWPAVPLPRLLCALKLYIRISVRTAGRRMKLWRRRWAGNSGTAAREKNSGGPGSPLDRCIIVTLASFRRVNLSFTTIEGDFRHVCLWSWRTCTRERKVFHSIALLPAHRHSLRGHTARRDHWITVPSLALYGTRHTTNRRVKPQERASDSVASRRLASLRRHGDDRSRG